MAIPFKLISKVAQRRVDKGKPITPFQMFSDRRNKRNTPPTLPPPAPAPNKNLPFILLGGLLVILLLNKK